MAYDPIPHNAGTAVQHGGQLKQLPWYIAFLFVIIPSVILFVAVDMVWITFVATPMFQAALGDLMRSMPNPISGALAWFSIVIGLYHFAAKNADNVGHAALQGGLLGMSLYGTYEFTNHSIIGTWTWRLALGDLAWGSFACLIAAAAQYKLLTWCRKRT